MKKGFSLQLAACLTGSLISGGFFSELHAGQILLAKSYHHDQKHYYDEGNDRNYSRYENSYNSSRREKDPWLNVEISREERSIIRNHYVILAPSPPPPQPVYYYYDDGYYQGDRRHHHKHYRRHLPHGWHKKLRRGYVIPQEIYRYAQPVPQTVIVQMPPQPPGSVLIRIDGKIIRLMDATKTIMDVFDM